MKTLFLDLIGGISGDMFLGAMVGLGVEPARLREAVRVLPLDKWDLKVESRMVAGIACTRLTVVVGDGHTHAEPHPGEHASHAGARSLADIRRMLESAPLEQWVKARALSVFRRLAEAEARVHNTAPDDVHFHEIGAVDSIVDIVGACVALDLLGRPRLVASVPVDGTGFCESRHGRLPVPAPATLEIFRAAGIEFAQCPEPNEMITPTGAAILAEFVEEFGPMPALIPETVAYSTGSRSTATRPNLLRAVLGRTPASNIAHELETDTVAVLETNLDDVNPQVLGQFFQIALEAGALDVFCAPITMKKNRPGVILSVLCPETLAEHMAALIFRHTGTLGIRKSLATRWKLKRELVTVQTGFGPVTVKLGRLGTDVVHAAPEFESCRAAAERAGVPVRIVQAAALAAVYGGDPRADQSRGQHSPGPS